MFFFIIECFSVIGIPLRSLEVWCAVKRNSINFRDIPPDLLEPMPIHYKWDRNREQKQRRRDDVHKNYPVIAALICTYNEPVAMVKKTLRAMAEVDYPDTCLDVYVCDDGRREEMRLMVRREARKRRNVHYETRQDNSHAKAGNLNHTLNKTQSDLFIVLDADFVVRPNLVQRLLPYFYNYSERLQRYQFNESLSCVQSPQQFRNLSPHDSDPLDQRSTMFFNLTQLSKDFFNASTLVGTTNLLARRPARDVGYFPNSVTEDSAMSIMLHSKGYRTYYVNEPLAHGLACTTLASNIGQRTRWMKGGSFIGCESPSLDSFVCVFFCAMLPDNFSILFHVAIRADFQILFSKLYSPIIRKGLSPMQRVLYLTMAYNRFTSFLNAVYEICIVLLLFFSISPLDVPNPRVFFCYLAAYLLMDSLRSVVLHTGHRQGLHKSEAGASLLETILRWKAIRGFFFAALHIGSVKFNVTKKSHDGSSAASKGTEDSLELDEVPDLSDRTGNVAVSGDSFGVTQAVPGLPPRGVDFTGSTDFVAVPLKVAEQKKDDSDQADDDAAVSRASSSRFTIGSSSLGSAFSHWRSSTFHQGSGDMPEKTVGEKLEEFKSSIRQVWFSMLFAAILISAIVWGVLNPPQTKTGTGVVNDTRTLSILGFGFAAAALMWHLAVILLAFLPYTSGWMMTDFVHGHCDQFARRTNGTKYVPLAWVSLLTFLRSLIILAFVSWLGYATWTTNFDEMGVEL